VRLLATPDRVTRELGAAPGSELELLRALWRMAGNALNDGAEIDVDALPRTFGGAYGATRLLDQLQGRQFLEWQKVGGSDRVTDLRRPLSAYPINWEALDRRRLNELAKLDSMQGYAYAKGCRRNYVLRYFGDPAAGKDCGGCDNCLGTHGAFPSARASLAKPKPGEKVRVRGGGRKVAADDVGDGAASPADMRLLERLRALRSTLAREQKVPAYVVFSDRTLTEMAVRRPRTDYALGEIHGVGPMKIEKYGEPFLALLRAADETEAA
jgi:ATP-dependent DNA helicase RecQ